MNKFVLISPKNRSAYNFRGDLIKAIQAKGYHVIVTGPNLDNIEKIEALGASFIEVPIDKNGLNPLSDIGYCFKLFKVLKKEKPDAILGYTIKPVIYGSIAGKLAKVRKRIAMVTGAGFLFSNDSVKASIIRKISFLLYRIGLGAAEKVIFQNSDDLNEFVEHKLVKRGKCYLVNGSGVNMNVFRPTPYPERPTFFFLGRFVHSKGGMVFAKAARIIKNQNDEARFIILGKFEKDLPDAIRSEELMPYIYDGTLELFPETDNIPDFFAMTSVFVLPTSYREGVPRSILEAMACARPIITTYTPGCKETVIEGENGLFTALCDPDDLAKQMLFFIENPNAIAQFGRSSYKICLNKYEVSIINRNMIRIMDV